MYKNNKIRERRQDTGHDETIYALIMNNGSGLCGIKTELMENDDLLCHGRAQIRKDPG